MTHAKQGVLPLSPTLDSVGTIARSVDCCQRIDAILAAPSQTSDVKVESLQGLKVGILSNVVNDGAEPSVMRAMENVAKLLQEAGAIINQRVSDAVNESVTLEGQPKIVSHEAYQQFKALLETRIDEFDQRVSSRILRGKNVSNEVYKETLAKRQEIIAKWHQEFSQDDLWIMPTVAIVAPLLDELIATDDVYFAKNALVLRNTGLFNFLDACAISLPCHRAGELPVGIMLVMPKKHDRKLLAVARLFEQMIQR